MFYGISLVRERCVFLLLALTIGLLGGCSTEVAQLRVGTNLWYGYEPAYVAATKGYFKSEKIRVVRLSSASEVIRAYRNGLIDVAAVTIDEALKIGATHGKQRIVLICDWSSGADALLAKPEYATLESLKGRTIGLEESALGAYMLSRALENGGLTATDVKTLNVPLLEHCHAYEKGLIDAVVTFEPHRTLLIQDGAHSLFDSAQIPNEIGDLLITSHGLSRTKEELLRDFMNGWFRALDFMTKSTEEAEIIVSKNQGISVDELRLVRGGIHLVGLEENARLLDKSGVEFKRILEVVGEKMSKHGLIDRTNILPDFDASFIPAK
jgi:NitT/TauT family transport system substrate-binding protein